MTDEYIERLNPNNPNEYQVGDKFVPFEQRIEYIKINGRERLDTLVVKSTRHGPVIEHRNNEKEVLTLRWAGFDFSPAEGFKAGFQSLKCNNFSDFQHNVTRFGALDANWIYADYQGNIGYQLGTPIPIRKKSAGHRRLTGWDDKAEWLGYYKLQQTPHALNPVKGWIASCNNKPDESNIEYPLHGNFEDERIKRITKLLSSMGKFSRNDMKKFQNDLISVGLIQWQDEAIKILDLMGKENLRSRMANWDGSANLNSSEIALLEIWLALLKKKTFEDEFGDLIDKFQNSLLFRNRNFYRIYMNNMENWFDNVETNDLVETRNDIAVGAMEEAITVLGDRTWADVQTLSMSHPLSVIPILSTFLSLEKGPFPRVGTCGSLNNTISFWNNKDSFTGRAGPSWRFILDFDDIDEAQMVIPAGQSGHPLSPHFFDFYDLWKRGEYWTVPFSEEKIKRRAVSKLQLLPRVEVTFNEGP